MVGDEKRKISRREAIKEFFSVPGKPVTNEELRDAWAKLTPEEKTKIATDYANSIGAELLPD